MYSDRDRTETLLKGIQKELDLIFQMSAPIKEANDFGTNLQGMTIFRACGMSLQYVTESFIKIRNLRGKEFFTPYKGIPWEKVFGMRNFLSHQYVEVDEVAFFSTIREDLPPLKQVVERMLQEVDPFTDE